MRPGFGVVGDDVRIDALWRLHEAGPCFPGRRIKSQEYILWRRVAGGLTRERQNKLLTGEIDRICNGKAPDELVRLTGSLELISHDTKAELVSCFLDIAVTLARAKQHCAPYLAALGLLLNRTPLYAGPELSFHPTSSSARTQRSKISIGPTPSWFICRICSFGPRASSRIVGWTCPSRCAP